jgi:hypothetical protein
MRRWAEVDRPRRGHGQRGAGLQAGIAPEAGSGLSFDAWLDVGSTGARFEFNFNVTAGPFRWTFDWRPSDGRDPEPEPVRGVSITTAVGDELRPWPAFDSVTPARA